MTAHELRILAHGASSAFRRALAVPSASQWLAVALLGLSGVAAFGLAPGTTLEVAPTRVVRLDLPPSAASVVDTGTAGWWGEERIRRGDTIGSVLARLNVGDPDALEFLRTDVSARAVYQLRPGKAIAVETGDDGRLLTLRFDTAGGERLTVVRNGEGFSATTAPAPVELRWWMASGEIRSSLFGAADAAGLPDAVTLQLADVFAGDIDFYHDLQRGDRFAVVWEVRYVDGEPVGPGRIVAAEFANRGKTLRAFLWRAEDGSESYFAEGGRPMRKSFLRSPMELSRVTSGFSAARFHPILQTWRAHKGVDYAAPTGTPVRATGDGTVRYAGRQNGYGNVIELQHRGSISTLYAHLSRFAPQMRNGTRVVQGEVIGYVGQTGWATGPHLHYEFRVADVERNPLTVVLPSGEPLAATHLAAFRERAAPAAAQLALAQQLAGVPVAATE